MNYEFCFRLIINNIDFQFEMKYSVNLCFLSATWCKIDFHRVAQRKKR